MNRLILVSLLLISMSTQLIAQPRNGSPSRIVASNLVGTYETAVTLGANTCGSVQVQPMPTIVTPQTADSTIVLTHAGIEHRGTITNNGAFRTNDLTLGAGVTTYRVSMRGQFATSDSFTAQVKVREMNNSAEKCAYEVKWVGTRRK